jgi:uncharacterized protein
MNDVEYRMAVKVADENRDRLRQLPELSRKEESLFKKIHDSKEGQLEKLELLFFEMDQIYDFANRFAVCKKGCAHCCQSAVDISNFEVEYIKINAGVTKFKMEEIDDSCPFLKNKSCSIYAFRPFLCRRHLSIADSAKWCELDLSHNCKFPFIHFAEVDKCYSYLLGPHGGKTIKDIRLAFT